MSSSKLTDEYVNETKHFKFYLLRESYHVSRVTIVTKDPSTSRLALQVQC